MKSEVKSSDAKASKCRLKFSSKMRIFIKLLCLGSVIFLYWQCKGIFYAIKVKELNIYIGA